MHRVYRRRVKKRDAIFGRDQQAITSMRTQAYGQRFYRTTRTNPFGHTCCNRRSPVHSIWRFVAASGSIWRTRVPAATISNPAQSSELRQYAVPDTAPTAEGRLFDLESDRGETTNVALTYPEIVVDMKAVLKQSISAGRSRPLAIPVLKREK